MRRSASDWHKPSQPQARAAPASTCGPAARRVCSQCGGKSGADESACDRTRPAFAWRTRPDECGGGLSAAEAVRAAMRVRPLHRHTQAQAHTHTHSCLYRATHRSTPLLRPLSSRRLQCDERASLRDSGQSLPLVVRSCGGRIRLQRPSPFCTGTTTPSTFGTTRRCRRGCTRLSVRMAG